MEFKPPTEAREKSKRSREILISTYTLGSGERKC